MQKKQGMKKERNSEERGVILSQYDASGQSVREFCKERGLAEHLLRYWLKRRSGDSGADKTGSCGGFSELRVAQGSSASLVLPQGLRIGLEGLGPRELAALLLELDRQGHA